MAVGTRSRASGVARPKSIVSATLATGHSATGYLATGYWLLATGYWLLATCLRIHSIRNCRCRLHRRERRKIRVNPLIMKELKTKMFSFWPK